jgi:hypothetical protein
LRVAGAKRSGNVDGFFGWQARAETRNSQRIHGGSSTALELPPPILQTSRLEAIIWKSKLKNQLSQLRAMNELINQIDIAWEINAFHDANIIFSTAYQLRELCNVNKRVFKTD